MGTTPEPELLPAIAASRADLPERVAANLDAPPPGLRGTLADDDVGWSTLEWGSSSADPVLLIHGVTSSAATWWRLGPALAAAGHRVVAVDQAGHGCTRQWLGHHRFEDNAADLVHFAGRAGIARDRLSVVGHSWGALTAAAFPAAGLAPSTLVLVDPPAIGRDVVDALLADPTERRYDDVDEAIRIVRRAHPDWSDGDVHAKAEGLTQFDEDAVRAIMVENEWDGGLAALDHPVARRVPVWVIRGDASAGSYLPDRAAAALARRVGRERVLTIAGAPHSPHRTHPEATLVALLMALGRR